MSTTEDSNPMEAHLQNALHVIESAKGVDPKMVHSSAGLLLISTKEKGLLFSVDHGIGVLLVNKKEDGGWSSPIAVRLDAIGVGAVFGYAKKDVLICLRPESLEKLMTGNSEELIGFEMGFALGNHGGATGPDISDRTMDGVTATSLVYTFSQGALMSIESVDGKIKTVPEVNNSFYGQGATLQDIVSGKAAIPEGSPQGDLITSLKTKVEEAAKV